MRLFLRKGIERTIIVFLFVFVVGLLLVAAKFAGAGYVILGAVAMLFVYLIRPKGSVPL